MTIRRLGPADWARFREIRLDMLRAAPRAFGSTHEEWAVKSEREIRAWLSAMHTLGLFDGARLVGTASFARRGATRAAHRAEVIAVYLRPEARGQGRAVALMLALAGAARAEGLVQLELEVADWNAPAIAAYERAGFRRVGVMPRAMRDGTRFTDDLILVRDLDAP
ncbi:GNAT family N-acetyltransferase [Roseicyclus persicicus]|uniref:GNAT family N-acetyltransferase n=1 Tax=Roseicyclus persicicus TaxID=2650661 RepID=A0A7X6GX19_9RHOB|nr:GNAT family N-acetyltransferase [Roseibacterium persicicum]NKX43967.1 GNAT family N-acetyltransferase [Roseibacterium persicicum]